MSVIDPRNVEVYKYSGSGDVDCSFGPKDANAVFSLVFLRFHVVRVSITGTSTATFTLSLHDASDYVWVAANSVTGAPAQQCFIQDMTLSTKTNAGYLADVQLRPDDIEVRSM